MTLQILATPGPGAAVTGAAPDRCGVMGVLNVTPDSFSDGGRYDKFETAVRHGLALSAAGADWVDVGGESTRPGAGRVDPAVEAARVVPVVGRLAAASVAVSIDTTRAAIAESAIGAGARLVNDVSGGRADSRMARVVANSGVWWVLNHARGSSSQMYVSAHYDDVVSEVCAELLQRVDVAVRAGVDPSQLILDPGLGFSKLPEHNWTLLAHLDRIVALGFPVLVGASRKRFLSEVSAPGVLSGDPASRDAATLASTVVAAQAGVWAVRVHDAAGSADAVRFAAALAAAR